MKKNFLCVLAVALVSLTGVFSAKAQELPQLPQDPALITGKLDNGLTYYIRHNETPRGQADFYIAQKVGSILEEDNQRGLAHFLEHMCFNGTENFPEKGIINYLESVGVKFGYNLNAYTSIDETVYNISAVPTARQSVQDSCLLILHDWSTALTLAPEEIDAERGVIHEEWRQSNVGSMRILERLLPVVYPDNKYGVRLPIGTMEVVDNFPYQALIDYYHKWYRPDQQAIIVVGDIDPVYIENKIKEIFSPIAMPENPAERYYVQVEDTPGTIYAIGADPEMNAPVVMMMFKSDDIKVPAEAMNTQMYYMITYMQRIISMMLNTRLDDYSKNPDCQYASAEVSIGDFFLAKTKGALSLEVVAKGGDVVPAFGEAYTELIRADQSGFTVGEYERARAEFLSQIDKQYNERNHRETDSYSREYVRLFTEGDPAPGIETEKQIFDMLGQMINVDMINSYFKNLVQDDNRVLLALLPEKEGYSIPTEEQLSELIEEIDEKDLEPFKDEVREDPLIPNLPAKGSVVSTRHLDDWDATEYTLSNGVKVVVKPTEFKANEIIFTANALGNGTATLDSTIAASVKSAPIGASVYGLNDYSNSDLQKYLAGKQLSCDFSMDTYTRSLEGQTTVADLPTFMEILYSMFTGFNLNESEFAATQASIAGLLANQESDPQFVFLKQVKNVLFNNAFDQSLTSDDIRNADRQTIIDLYRNALKNAADYTFYFVGDIDTETLVPLMEQYIATLPADAATATTSFVNNPDFELTKGSGLSESKTAMQTPQSWVFIEFSGSMPYTAKNKALATVAAQILSKRLLNKVREEMGAVYSIGAQGGMNRTDEINTIFQMGFPMKPEMRNEVLSVIKGIVNACTEDVTAEELRPAIEFMTKDASESLEKNEDWAAAMSAVSINGVQTFTNAAETVAGITVEDVQNYLKELLQQGNYREIILDPEEITEAVAE